MAHQIDMTNDRANMAFVGSRDQIWHGLGQQLTENASIEDWKREAGMDWEIVETPVQFVGIDGNTHTVNDKKVLYRGDTHAPLSVVGSDYKTIQPGEVLEFFRDIVSDNGMYLETAGCLFGGRRFWAMANTKKVSYIGMPDDIVKGHLLLATSADGTMASVASFQSTRVVCNNTLRIALNEAKANRVRVTHRTEFNPEMVKSRLGLYDEAWDQYIENANKLASKKVSDLEAKAIIDSLILSKPEDPTKSSMQSQNQADFIMSLYKGAGMGSDMTYGNGYGVLNAVTEYVDHHSRNRTADSKLWNQFFGAGDKLKQDAFETLMQLA